MVDRQEPSTSSSGTAVFTTADVHQTKEGTVLQETKQKTFEGQDLQRKIQKLRSEGLKVTYPVIGNDIVDLNKLHVHDQIEVLTVLRDEFKKPIAVLGEHELTEGGKYNMQQVLDYYTAEVEKMPLLESDNKYVKLSMERIKTIVNNTLRKIHLRGQRSFNQMYTIGRRMEMAFKNLSYHNNIFGKVMGFAVPYEHMEMKDLHDSRKIFQGMKQGRKERVTWLRDMMRMANHSFRTLDYKAGQFLRQQMSRPEHQGYKRMNENRNKYHWSHFLQEHPKNRLGNLGYAETYTQRGIPMDNTRVGLKGRAIQAGSSAMVEVAEAFGYALAELVYTKTVGKVDWNDIENHEGYLHKMSQALDEFTENKQKILDTNLKDITDLTHDIAQMTNNVEGELEGILVHIKGSGYTAYEQGDIQGKKKLATYIGNRYV